ncbi:hypothetical protein [Natronobacterium texcoconense]|uniref:Uncharacterized protein n=1 Tax=Natronobacterium texcoconense TaxID=1095778 RepID=A0A1H1IWR6_NATTX|nr:hypothetical protein [Natronobacterium texcoconense]SDR42144.1 hypothetical protein SAMN04489842_3865 [Natronobacterium texcoconense]
MTDSMRRRQFVGSSVLAVGTAGCLETVADAGSGEETDDSDGQSRTEPVSVESDTVLLSVERDGEMRDAVTAQQVAEVGTYEYDDRYGTYYVPLLLTEDGTESFVDALEAVDAFDEPTSTEIHTHLEGEPVDSHALGPDLADAMQSGEFDGQFRPMFPDEESAASFHETLADA